MKRHSFSVSDHVLIRWLQRVHGIDMEKYRDILREEIRPFMEAGLTQFNYNGMTWIARNNQLITVTPREMKDDGHEIRKRYHRPKRRRQHEDE